MTQSPLLARHSEFVSYQKQHAEAGIPMEVMESLAANKVFPIVSPVGLVGRNAHSKLRGWPGLTISMAECEPGHGPVIHNHTGTLENFYCLDGPFDLLWGNQLEFKLRLEPGDFCSVPPGVYRTFRNRGDHDASLLVLIQGDRQMTDNSQMPRSVGEAIRQKHGDKVIDLLRAINMRFEGDDAAHITEEAMSRRLARANHPTQPWPTRDGAMRPVMSPEPGKAPVQGWIGMEVAVLGTSADGTAQDTVADQHLQWLINVGQGHWTVTTDEGDSVLGRFDILGLHPGTSRRLTSTNDDRAELLVINQSRETVAEAVRLKELA